MSDRDKALAAVRRRVEHAGRSGDASGLLTREAVRDAAKLVGLADRGTDLEVIHVLGWFHWMRYRVLPEGADQEDLRLALGLLRTVFGVDPEAVPAELREVFDSSRDADDSDGTSAAIDAEDMFDAFVATREPSLLRQAIEIMRGAIAATPANDTRLLVRISNLSAMLGTLFEATRDTSALAEALETIRRAVAAMPPDFPDRATLLNNLATRLRNLSAATDNVDYLEEAVRVGRDALEAASDESSEYRYALSNYATSLLELFDRTRTAEPAMELARLSRRHTSSRGFDLGLGDAKILARQAQFLRLVANQTGRIDVREEVVSLMRLVVAAVADGHPDKARYLFDLTEDLTALAEDGGSSETGLAVEAEEVARAAAEAATSAGDHNRSAYLLNLSAALSRRYLMSGDKSLLYEAIEVGRAAVDAASADDPALAACLSALGMALQRLYEAEGDPATLAEAVDVNRAAAAAATADNPNKPRLLSNYASTLTVFAEATGDISVLEEAAGAGREAVAVAPADHPRRFIYLATLGNTLAALATSRGDSSHQREAISVMHQALEVTPTRHPNRGAVYFSLGKLLHDTGALAGDRAVLSEAVEMLRAAAAETPPGHLNHASYHIELSNAAADLFALTADTDLLVDSVAAGRAARDALPGTPGGGGDGVRLGLLARLVTHLQLLYNRTGEIDLLRESVGLGKEVLEAIPGTHSTHALVASQVGLSLAKLGKANGDRSALVEAVETARAAANTVHLNPDRRYLVVLSFTETLRTVSEATDDLEILAEAEEVARAECASAGDGEAALFVADLAVSLAAKYERTQQPETLAEFVGACRAAADVATSSSSHKDLLASTLAEIFQDVMGLTDPADELGLLDPAIRVGRAAVALTPPGSLNRAARLSLLVTALEAELYIRRNDDLHTEAVDLARAAVDATPIDGLDRPRRLAILARRLCGLFEVTGDIALLAEAAKAGRSALSASPADVDYLSGLSMILVLVARHSDPAAITEAIKLGRAAVDAAAQDDADRGSLLNSLGSALLTCYELTGDVAALAEAAEIFRAAVAATAMGLDRRTGYAHNLVNALGFLYRDSGNSEFLVEAVETSREMVAATPPGHPEYARRLAANALSLYYLHGRTGRTDLLAEAVQTGRVALGAAPESSPDYASYLTEFGAVLRRQYDVTGDTEVLVEAAALFERAVRLTPADHPTRAFRLANLASILMSTAALGTEPDRDAPTSKLAKAVDLAREAVVLTSFDHPQRAGLLIMLGNASFLLFLMTASDDPTDAVNRLREARSCFERAAESTTASAKTRLDAYRLMLNLGTDRALSVVEDAVSLLPLLADRALTRADRQFRLAELKGSMAAQFASVALAADKSQRAVEILEQTRGILVADSLRARSSDLSRLEEARPDLAANLRSTAALLDALENDVLGDAVMRFPEAADTSSPYRPRQEAQRADLRRDALADHRRILAEIRAHDEFRDFLSPTFAQLVSQAEEGPVVFIYAGPEGGTAIIVDAHRQPQTLSIRLAGLIERDTFAQTEILLEAAAVVGDQDADPAARIQAQTEIHDVLRWMWGAIAQDVLNALGYGDRLPEDLTQARRMWWCPVGVVGFMPLHAAGHHEDLNDADRQVRANPRTVLDRVVSSYAPTLQSLAFARTRAPDPELHGSVVVAVPDAPGMPLPSAEDEASAVEEALRDVQVLTDPSRDDVVEILPNYLTAHFACHGLAAADPAASRLILSDHLEKPLTVADLNGLRLASGLAYLSACETSISSLSLVDEAVHLTGAFHLAGYRHVVGTLWPIGEFASRRLAAEFYTRLAPDRAEPIDLGTTAYALHSAVCQLRSDFPNAPSAWAAHLHTGP